ncbi:MAG: DNA-directed DNA polymerase II small subunit [Thermoplasmata archaeon]|nr:DNA-directed DNA polymerase II small subunit [Thermoplasmata archaeon]
MKKRILQLLTDKGVLVDPEAADALSRLKDPMACVERILNDAGGRPLILSKEDVDNYASCAKAPDPRPEPAKERAPERAHATKAKPAEVRVLKDITGDSTCVGDIIDFTKLFNDRYTSIKRMLAKRRELAGIISIAKAKKVKREVRLVGMLNDTRTTKHGHTLLEIEDETDKIQVLVMKGPKRAGDGFIKDEVLGISGSFSKDGEIVIAKEIVRPDVPMNSAMTPNGSGAVMAFVSDIHVGSDTFLPDEWKRFMEWLRKDPVAKDIRYMMMPGDLVDGIGIYPGQEDELLIEDVFAQYRELSEMVKAIPDWIKVVMMPGNHDAVRLAEPQPALSKDVQSMFDSNILFVGNPCYLEVEGRVVLAYHGRSMDDYIKNIPGLDYSHPLEAMREMLRRRHLAPVYGERTALAPEKKDYLVIDQVPNIFVTGHVHKCGIAEYRGIKLINASAWQSQTEFQRMHNQVPDPAKVPMIDLGNGEMWVEDFSG